METKYFIFRNNQQEGPFSLEDLFALSLPKETLVWTREWEAWRELSSLDEWRERMQPEESSSIHYYFVIEGVQQGPYTFDELREQLPTIRSARYVWKEGTPHWVTLNELPELNELLVATSTPPAPSGQKDSSLPPLTPPSAPFETRREGDSLPPPYQNNTHKKSIFHYFIECFTKKYFAFSGRANRREFWGFVLCSYICLYVLRIPIYGWFYHSFSFLDDLPFFPTFTDSIHWISYFFYLFALIPFLAVAVRRLHDTQRSGTNLLWLLLPAVGWIILLLLLVQESDLRPNRYGDPV